MVPLCRLPDDSHAVGVPLRLPAIRLLLLRLIRGWLLRRTPARRLAAQAALGRLPGSLRLLKDSQARSAFVKKPGRRPLRTPVGPLRVLPQSHQAVRLHYRHRGTLAPHSCSASKALTWRANRLPGGPARVPTSTTITECCTSRTWPPSPRH